MTKKTLPKTIYPIWLIAGILLAFASMSAKAESESPVMVTYTYEHELLPKMGNEPLLTIFVNGKMRAVFPSFMKRPGKFKAELPPSSFQELKTQITTALSQNINTSTISDEMSSAQNAQLQTQPQNGEQSGFSVSDSTTYIIRYESPQSVVMSNVDLSNEIVQKDLTVMAEHFPNINTLQISNNLKKILQNILEKSDWKPEGNNE
ncbi:MAG: hypothetical protein KAH20_04570 [Methylococcales bacterium]|nr:hypothetical protein [Methylococcales bacterium]